MKILVPLHTHKLRSESLDLDEEDEDLEVEDAGEEDLFAPKSVSSVSSPIKVKSNDWDGLGTVTWNITAAP